MRWMLCPFAALLATTLAGCPEPTEPDIELYPFTNAPVGRTAVVRNDYDPPAHDIAITRGVVVGVSCWDSCDYYCLAPAVTSADESVVRVRPVYRASSTTTQFVLVAVAPGATEVTVQSACAERSYPVSVLED